MNTIPDHVNYQQPRHVCGSQFALAATIGSFFLVSFSTLRTHVKLILFLSNKLTLFNLFHLIVQLGDTFFHHIADTGNGVGNDVNF